MLEVQDIFRAHGTAWLTAHHPPAHVCRAARTIQGCRTASLGAHRDTCDECGHVQISYNSCRNRHCPKCQALSKEKWVAARGAELLPAPYFHVVFTLPDALHSLAMQNRRTVFNLQMKCAAQTVLELAADKKYLGAQVAVTAVLHTWGQNLLFHPHVHLLVSGGGLAPDGRWVPGSHKFFLPVKVMARKFRGKFLAELKKAELEFGGALAHLREKSEFACFLAPLYDKDWYAYCKRPFKTPASVLKYLGRYTHRVAFSNHRLVKLENGQVTFKWRDYRDGSTTKQMTLSADEFIRRFLLHVLPPGFTKIRHYGLLAPASKAKKLALCWYLAGVNPPPRPEPRSAAEWMQALTGKDITLCPVCGTGHLTRAPPLPQTA